MSDKSHMRVGKDELYDPLIEFFLKTGSNFLEVYINGINSRCLIINLNKSIKEKGLEDRIRTVIINNVVYLVQNSYARLPMSQIPSRE